MQINFLSLWPNHIKTSSQSNYVEHLDLVQLT